MFRKFSLFFVSIITLSGCSSSEEKAVIAADSFDRSILLENIADNIIIPAYEDFSIKMSALKTSGETFTTKTTQTNLTALRASWFAAYKTWQHIEMFNIGKAEQIQFSFYMNIYPLTVKDVEDNISNGNYDLNSLNNQDAQGFPALDYLLYGVADTDATILEKYSTGANKENYKKYITAVLNQMNTLTIQVVLDFKAKRNTFVSNTSNSLTGSVNELINDYIFYYEKRVRAGKFGIPAGVFSSNPLPEKVEAFYKNDISKELSLEALTAVENLFEGKHYTTVTKGVSLKDYLIKLNRADIATAISSQFESAKAEVNKLNNSFFIQINSDNTAMTKSYDELQKAVVLLKVDMLQAFNVSVDYVDADGD